MTRPLHPKPKNDTGYPSLSEHLLTRRDLLTWMGASVVTGTLWVSCSMGDDDSGPDYYTARLPSEGEDLATFGSGGACRYFVTVTVASDHGYYDIIDNEGEALDLCRTVLGRQDLAALASARTGGSAEPYYTAELQISQALGANVCTDCYSLWVTLAILEFLA